MIVLELLHIIKRGLCVRALRRVAGAIGSFKTTLRLHNFYYELEVVGRSRNSVTWSEHLVGTTVVTRYRTASQSGPSRNMGHL